ncbi:Hypothetical predicted protein [Mytilus galloprovincialis]|uniref:Uncharacterized protein n=1 Tax=Mytilus galloprovincialis TaxID=29158 RepID=A0A8B6CQ62_MYTGA|nr:Hypothetical predicted protein [Mytilus galloprovincialis]
MDFITRDSIEKFTETAYRKAPYIPTIREVTKKKKVSRGYWGDESMKPDFWPTDIPFKSPSTNKASGQGSLCAAEMNKIFLQHPYKKKFLKYTVRPSFKSCTVFNEDLVVVENLRTDILMNQPVYVVFSILDLSKHLMHDFHYKHMKTLYWGKIRLCFTDTDSFLYHIQTEDMYDDMMEYQDMFDTSEYDEVHMLHSNHNKKVLGKFKDKTKRVPISEFVG